MVNITIDRTINLTIDRIINIINHKVVNITNHKMANTTNHLNPYLSHLLLNINTQIITNHAILIMINNS